MLNSRAPRSEINRMMNREMLLEFAREMAVAGIETVLSEGQGPAEEIEIAAALERRHETARELAQTAATVERLGDGWEHETYLVDEQVVFRSLARPAAATISSPRRACTRSSRPSLAASSASPGSRAGDGGPPGFRTRSPGMS